jgi:hypothetical protein
VERSATACPQAKTSLATALQVTYIKVHAECKHLRKQSYKNAVCLASKRAGITEQTPERVITALSLSPHRNVSIFSWPKQGNIIPLI